MIDSWSFAIGWMCGAMLVNAYWWWMTRGR